MSRKPKLTDAEREARYQAARRRVIDALNRAGVECMPLDDAAKLLPVIPEWE